MRCTLSQFFLPTGRIQADQDCLNTKYILRCGGFTCPNPILYGSGGRNAGCVVFHSLQARCFSKPTQELLFTYARAYTLHSRTAILHFPIGGHVTRQSGRC